MQKKFSIIAGPSCIELATKVGHILGGDIILAKSHTFTDGESKIKWIELRKILYSNTINLSSSGSSFTPSFDDTKKCTDDKAVDLCIVIPYLAYTRQDRAFLKNEFMSISLVAKLLEAVGTKRLDTHGCP